MNDVGRKGGAQPFQSRSRAPWVRGFEVSEVIGTPSSGLLGGAADTAPQCYTRSGSILTLQPLMCLSVLLGDTETPGA